MTAIPDGNLIFAVRIEGFGNGDGQYYFSTGKPRSIVAGAQGRWLPHLYKEFGGDDNALDQFSVSVNWQTGASTLPEWTIKLNATDQIYSLFHGHLAPIAIDQILLVFLQGATSLTFAAGSPSVVPGDVVNIGRESIKLGPEGVPGTFDPCIRGYLGTQDVAHKDPFRAVMDDRIYDLQMAPTSRRAEFGYLTEQQWQDDGLDTDADFSVIQTFMTREIGSPDGGASVSVRTTGVQFALADTKLYDRRWRGIVSGWAPTITAVSRPPGSALRAGVNTISSIRVVQKLPPGEASFYFPRAFPAAPTNGESQCWVRFRDSACPLTLIDATEGIYALDWPDNLPNSPAIDGSTIVPGEDLWEFITSMPEAPTPTPVFATLQTLPLGNSRDLDYGDVITIVLQLLTSTDRGENGSHDLGFDCGIKMPEFLIDFDTMERLRGRIGARTQYKGLVVGAESEAPNAKEWIETHLLAPFRLVWGESGAGLLTLKHLDDLPPINETLIAYTDDDLWSDEEGESAPIAFSDGLEGIRDTVRLMYAMTPTGELRQFESVNETVQEFLLSSAGPVEIQAAGLRNEDQAAIVNQVLQWTWRRARPTFDFSLLLRDAPTVGSAFLMTSGQLPDVIDGVVKRGCTDVVSYVTGTTHHLEGPEVKVDVKAVLWGLGGPNLGYIGIALEVVSGFSYSIGTGTVEFTISRYQSPVPSFVYDRDVRPVEAGWEMRQIDQFGASINAPILVASRSIGASTVTFSPFPASWDAGTPPVAGEVFKSANWAVLTEDAQKRFVHQADAAGELGAGDPGFLWAI